MNAKDLLIYLIFALGTFLVISLGCAGIILSAMSDTFPYSRFFIILISMIVVTWSIGLGLRKHRLLIAERNKEKTWNTSEKKEMFF
jgi:hypothetical protein